MRCRFTEPYSQLQGLQRKRRRNSITSASGRWDTVAGRMCAPRFCIFGGVLFRAFARPITKAVCVPVYDATGNELWEVFMWFGLAGVGLVYGCVKIRDSAGALPAELITISSSLPTY